MGFYPVCPGSNEYAIGTPYFDKMTLHLPQGNALTITAEGNSTENRYVDSITFNGTSYSKNYFTHEDLLKGGSIVCRMAGQPNTSRGTSDNDFPYSFTNEK